MSKGSSAIRAATTAAKLRRVVKGAVRAWGDRTLRERSACHGRPANFGLLYKKALNCPSEDDARHSSSNRSQLSGCDSVGVSGNDWPTLSTAVAGLIWARLPW